MIQNVKNRFQNHKIPKGRDHHSQSIDNETTRSTNSNSIKKIKQNLMAVIAEGMTFDAIDATPTAAARITFALKLFHSFHFPILNLNN
jgi:hypothetical protein